MKPKNSQEKKNIVVLGAGFAGIRAALDLQGYLHDSDQYEIILVDRRDYQTYYSGLYEAATTEHAQVEAKTVKRTVTIPLSDVFGRGKVKIFKGYVERIDLENGQVVTDSRIIPYDYLVGAMGSVADFYDIPNLDKYGFTLKSLDDAIMIRNRIEDLVIKKNSANIIVGGGGFAGVEFVGELHNLLKHECEVHQKDLNQFKITVVEGAKAFLPGLSDKVAAMVSARLGQMMVETKFSSLLTEAGKDYIVLNMKDRLDCDLLIWTGGVRAAKLPTDISLEHDKKDRVMVSEFLNLKYYHNVLVVGDNACFMDVVTNRAAAQTAQEAIRQGAHAAKNIFRMIKRKNLLPYHVGSVRFVIPVSGKYAIFYTPNLIVSGFWGWTIRKLADLRYFMSILPWPVALKYWLFENKIFMKND
jgi:NADH dehydrogenase